MRRRRGEGSSRSGRRSNLQARLSLEGEVRRRGQKERSEGEVRRRVTPQKERLNLEESNEESTGLGAAPVSE